MGTKRPTTDEADRNLLADIAGAKAEHTPGPWGWQFFGPHLALVGKHSDRPIILDVTPKGVMRLRVGHIMRPITMVAECEEHPDLQLLTAAPDLLAACKEALEYITDPPCGETARPIVTLLRAAIAKAGGAV